jgi:hypothetical protein
VGVKVSKSSSSKTKSSVKDATHKLQETQLGCASVNCSPRVSYVALRDGRVLSLAGVPMVTSSHGFAMRMGAQSPHS